jgi:hypothetical protein
MASFPRVFSFSLSLSSVATPMGESGTTTFTDFGSSWGLLAGFMGITGFGSSGFSGLGSSIGLLLLLANVFGF